MPIFKTPQDTRAARGLKPTVFVETCQEIQQRSKRLTSTDFEAGGYSTLSSNRDLPKEPGAYVYGVINGGIEAERHLAQAFHPIVVPMPKIGDQVAYNIMVGDVRPFTRVEGSSVQITALKGYLLVRVRTILSTLWANGQHGAIGHISPLLGSIFGSWIADVIQYNYKLDGADFVRMRICAAYYYRCLHSEATEVDVSNRRALAAVLARHLHVEPNEVEDVIEKVGVIKGLEDFVIKLKDYLKAPQLTNFDAAAFVTLMGGSWHGFGGADMSVCALEHPPTFVAMVYMSFSERGFKTTGLAQKVERFRKNDKEIVKGVERLLKADYSPSDYD